MSIELVPAEELHPLHPLVMEEQATINIGTIGHVAHGKSTLVYSITGVQTVRYKKELERNITIKLGYANAKIYKCDNPECPPPGCYCSYGSGKRGEIACKRPGCGGKMVLQRHVSFVDCPGHDVYMATMLNGTAVMDAALLLVAGNESCPQPQTGEHLAAVEIMNLSRIIVLQNKIDLIPQDSALKHRDSIRKFIRGTKADRGAIIPISAVLGYNIDAVCQYIVEGIPIPPRDYTSSPRMIIIRSFDINKPGETVENLKGGVLGGTLMRGVLRLGDELEVLPGVVTKDSRGNTHSSPLLSFVRSLRAEQNSLKIAVPGGLIGVGTDIDPALTRADRLIGHVLGLRGHLPPVFVEIIVEVTLLVRLLGTKTEEGNRQPKVAKLVVGETLLLNIGASGASGEIMSNTSGNVRISLKLPVCVEIGETIALSRRIDGKFRLIGWGQITKGFEPAS